MKRLLGFVLCMSVCLGLAAQQDLGIRNGNYAGIQGALLNPSSIADSKLKWDVNVLSVEEVFDNNFLYAPKSSLKFLGFKNIIEGAIHETIFGTHYDPGQPNKLYNLTFSTEILGPSFFIKVAKKHEIGLTIAGRGYANIRDITGNLGQNAFAYFQQSSLWDTTFHDNTTRVNTMGWLEYGLHYATVIYSQGRDELKMGLSLNYLQGIAAAYAKNVNVNYNIADTAHLIFTNSSIDYGRTNTDTYRKISSYNDLNHGHGFGMDIGFTYVHLTDQAAYTGEQGRPVPADPEKSNYVYRIGISLLDIGSINFNRNAAAYHLQANGADFSNWHQSKFSGNEQLDQTLSAVFYHGDSTRSLAADHFNMGLPSAVSIQADWNVYEHFFANATIIKGFGHGSGQGVTRPDVYSITPRYETKNYEVSLPMSLLYYGVWRPRLGLALRAGYFFIGGDAPGSILKLRSLEGADFYAGVHFFIAEKGGLAKK
jgi:hypothetical protein